MNKFLDGLREADNYTFTENGAVTHKSSMDALLDLFGMGGAYRNRSDEDCIVLFMNAFKEDESYAMKCLFYLRDIMEGQGERRFFRVVCHYLAQHNIPALQRNLKYISDFGRWDDIIYICYETKFWKDCIDLIKNQLILDIQSVMTSGTEGVSLLGKWLPSENTSSPTTRKIAHTVRQDLGMSHKQYRKILSTLRARINVLECLMSAGKWDEIEFDKIPSKAGFKYRNAFARHDIDRMKSEKAITSYEDFMKDETTTVNADTLYPYEVVAQAYRLAEGDDYWFSPRKDLRHLDPIQRAAINKYWDNLKDYFNGCSLDALCVVDTSGSMWGSERSAPINVAISLGLYAAERARGPFTGHYISFSSRPQLIKTEGVDFVDKVWRIYKTNLCENTDIEKTFDLLLSTAINNNCTQAELPKNIVIISDMEFDQAQGYYCCIDNNTLMENIKYKWEMFGYKMPNLVFWNVDARHNNIPMTVKDGVTLVSGFSPVIFEMVMKGKTGVELMLDKLNSKRYACIK